MGEARYEFALGVDIGGSGTKIGLVDRAGAVTAARCFATAVQGDQPGQFIAQLLAEVGGLLASYPQEVIGIGVSFLGWLNEACTGPQFCMNAPGLHQVDFKGLFAEAFRLPVVVHDDVTAHTLAEYHYGSGRGSRRFLCLAMGTGLGAGVIINGQPLRFTGGCAGDTGHIILRPGGPPCTSGCRGCGEALIGVAGIERLAVEQYGDHRCAAELIGAAARGGDAVAAKVLAEIGQYTGELLASLFRIFLPEKIALAGGASRAGPVLLDAAIARFEDLSGDYYRTYASLPGVDFRGVQIVPASLEGETAVVGAATEFFRDAGLARSS